MCQIILQSSVAFKTVFVKPVDNMKARASNCMMGTAAGDQPHVQGDV